MNIEPSLEQLAFRAEVRDFIRRRLPVRYGPAPLPEAALPSDRVLLARRVPAARSIDRSWPIGASPCHESSRCCADEAIHRLPSGARDVMIRWSNH